MRVLVAEDGPDNQVLIRTVLRNAGAEVDLAVNGRIACEMVAAAQAAAKPYDVILMDMQMPELDGYDAAARLRGEGYRRPIVALTAHAMSSDRDRCLAAGCDDFCTKPFDFKKLIEQVAKHAGLSGG